MINVCLLSFSSKTLSIGAGSFDEGDFRNKILESSGDDINIRYLLGPNRECIDPFYVHRIKRTVLPASLNIILGLIKHVPFLLSQDVIVTPGIDIRGFFVSLFCTLFRKKSMITVHGHMFDELRLMGKKKTKLYMFFISYFVRCTLKYANSIISINEKINDEMECRGADQNKLSLRYVFVDTNKFNKLNVDPQLLDKFKWKYKIPTSYLLFVGHYDEKDRPLEVLNIYKKILPCYSGVKLVMVGDGKYKQKVNNFIKANKLEEFVVQVNRVTHDEMIYLYYDALMCLIPIYPPGYGVGKIRLEALSMEVPVLVYDIPAGYKIVQNDYNGYRIPLGGVEQMSEKIIFLLNNKKKRELYGKNGRMSVIIKNDVYIYIKNWVNSIYNVV